LMNATSSAHHEMKPDRKGAFSYGLLMSGLLVPFLFITVFVQSFVSAQSKEKVAVLLLIWLTASMAWLGTRGFRMALSWSHNSQMRALQLLSELRARRGETAPMPPLIVEIALRDIWKTYAVIGVSLVVLIVGTARLLKSLRMFEAVKLGSQLTG